MDACVQVSSLAVMDAMSEAEIIDWHGNREEDDYGLTAGVSRDTVADELSFDLLDMEMRRTPNDAPVWEDGTRGVAKRRMLGRTR